MHYLSSTIKGLLCTVLCVVSCTGSADKKQDVTEHNQEQSLAKGNVPIPTVQIGNQLWMSNNLNVSTFRNGDPIPKIESVEEWEEAAENQQPAWCFYNNDPVNGRKYGKLYNWYAVNDSRGLAPEGWHIPSTLEWADLTEYLGGENVAGTAMKSQRGWYSNGNGTNISGFSGLPGGRRYSSGFFEDDVEGYFGSWWSTSEYEATFAFFRRLNYWDGKATRSGDQKGSGFSVRCLRD